MTDETSPEEWYAWMLRERFRHAILAATCPRKIGRLINAMRNTEQTYYRGVMHVSTPRSRAAEE